MPIPLFWEEGCMLKEKVQLEEAIESINNLCKQILEQKNYQKDLPQCVEKINTAMSILLKDASINSLLLVQLLQDMMHGVENQDEVLLLDVLRFGIKIILEDYSQEIG